MKVDNLLGPYLYQFKKLSLPGIGMFLLDEKAVLPDDSAKVKIPIEGISFNPKTGAQLDDSLIQFIKEQTGKMKPLAEADLYSFITTAFQFLNIGKPFYFEGIGTLQKNKDGGYAFTAGTVIPQKAEEAPARFSESNKKSTYSTETAATRSAGNANSGKILVVAGIVITLLIIGLGGYYLYTKNTPAQNETKNIVTADTTTAATTLAPADSSGKKPADSTSIKKDSVAATQVVAQKDSATVPAGGIKFILETTARKARALSRYTQLKGVSILKPYNNMAALETKDSLSFDIYTVVNCPTADTAKVKDMLNAWYYGKKEMKVKVAH